MNDYNQDDDGDIEAEIQRELDALNLEDEDETNDQYKTEEEYQQDEDTDAKDLADKLPASISDFIQRVQSRSDDFQKELSECDSLLSGVVTAKEDEREEFFYQSKALKEFAFQIGEDPEELRDRVIQELAEEDEEDSKLLPIDGQGVKVLALEGPLFEEQNEFSQDSPLPAIEGPHTDDDGQAEGREVVFAEKSLQVYAEPVQQFEGVARKKVKEFEDRYDTQLQEYRKDYEEGQRSTIRREKEAEEDRARRRRENDEEQRQLAQERMIYQSQIQEKLDELEKNTKESLENYENEIKKLEARTNQERKEFEEQFLKQQQQKADKRCTAAIKIQAAFRSYRARKPLLKKMRLIKEEVKKRLIDKRQMEIAAEKKQEEQRKRKEREEKKRKEEEMRRKVEEERKKQEEDERKERERLEKEKLEKERQERQEMDIKRAEEERKKKEQREMEEKANEILAKIMKEKQRNDSDGNDSQEGSDGSLVQPAVKVNILNSQDMNIHYANEDFQGKDVNKSQSDGHLKVRKIEKEREEIQQKDGEGKNLKEEGIRRRMQNDSVSEERVMKENTKKGKGNFLKNQGNDSDCKEFVDTDNREGIAESEQTLADQQKKEDRGDNKTDGRGKVENQSCIKNQTFNLNSESGKVVDDSAQMKEITRVKTEDFKKHKRDEDCANSPQFETEVQFEKGNIRTRTDEESIESKKSSELTVKITNVTKDVEKRDLMGTLDKGNSADAKNMENVTNSKMLHGKDETKREKSLKYKQEEEKADFGNEVSMVTSSHAPAMLDVAHGRDSSGGGIKENLNEEYQKARLEWMKTSISFSKQLIQAKDHLREQEKKKRRYLRRPSAVKKMNEISEEVLLGTSPAMKKTLAEVTTVELQDLPGCVLTTLSKCPNMRVFACHSSKIQYLEGLDQSPDISYIDVKGNQIANVSCRDRTKLTFLDLSENNLSTVQGLEGCTSLKWLNLSNNRISRLSGIEYLLSLVHLDVSNNQLINGQGLSALVHLVSLDASHNHLSSLPSLASCVLLRTMNLRGNSLSEVPDLSNHVLLTELFLDNNSLVSMETMKLSWLPRLHSLSLSQNSLPTVPVLKYAPLLKKLDLRNNYITDISSLSDGLSCQPFLEHLHIDGNPVTEESDCRAEILKLVPSLRYLEDDSLQSPASQRPQSQFEEMCLSQMTAEDALTNRHLEVIQSLITDDRYLQNVAGTWSAYLDFWLKMVIDHRYMHEYGDLSLVTCQAKDLRRMIPEPGARETSSGEKRKLLVKQQKVDETIPHRKDSNTKRNNHLTTSNEGAMEGDESRQSLKMTEGESRVGGIDKGSVPQPLLQATGIRSKANNSDMDRQNEAAVRIQAIWRGFEVRRDLEFHSKQYLAAVLIQSTWRGHRMRQRYLKARAALQNQKSEEQEEEEFDFNEDLDLEFLEFSEENLEKGWIPSETPEVPSSHPVLPSKHIKTSPFHERPVSSISTRMSPSPEKIVPHPPKQAWRGTNSPLAPLRNHASVPQDTVIPHGKPPLPPVTPASSRTESVVSSTPRTVRSKKEQELSEEWGFKDNVTAELMMRRAKKMNQSKKKKNLDPVKKYQMFKKLQESQTTREVHQQSKRGIQRKEYFKAKEEAVEQKTKEVHQRTYEWVHSQSAFSDDASVFVDSNQTFRSRHSSSDPSLPRMSPDVLQGRVHLTASPTIDVQSVDGSSMNGVAVRGRSNSFSSPDGERLPPIKTNSAPTSHVRQRQAAKVSSHEGSCNPCQAWGRSPKGKR